jgi:hypothetical protein
VQVQNIKILFQLLNTEQICSQLQVIAATFALDLLDNELRAAFHKQLSGLKGQSGA